MKYIYALMDGENKFSRLFLEFQLSKMQDVSF